MRVPVSWLRSYCNPALSDAELADRLAMTGTEVARLEHVGVAAQSLDHFVVGKVLDCKPHPRADRLTLCSVDDGAQTRQIVCGAPNVEVGQTVAVATPGAKLANGTELSEVKLRGESSQGMICAEDELGIGTDHSGILVLPDELAAGVELSDYLQISDELLELEVTPNRPDCLSIYGTAREVHAVTGAPLASDPGAEDIAPNGPGRASDYLSIEIADEDICPRFTARIFVDVTIGPSPAWLKARLSAAGQRPISNVVDITNYVMLVTGQPLHAFDLDQVRGAQLVVRRAQNGEKITTLDGIERALDDSMAVICDQSGPSSIAGLMGGSVSEVSEATSRIAMESATWVGTNILQTSSALGVRSEASTRFEKQLHPQQAIAAQRLASRLMVEVCGARLCEGTIDVYPSPAQKRNVVLRPQRIESLLGERIPQQTVQEILESLGFGVWETSDGFSVEVPPFRDTDIQREADLIEEVARVYGLDRIPVTLPARTQAVGKLSRPLKVRRKLEDSLRERGLLEVVTYSFTSPTKLERLGLSGQEALGISNPLAADQSVMRPLLLVGLCDAAAYNAAHDRPALPVFESAHVYTPADTGAVAAQNPQGALPAGERHHIGGLINEGYPGSWRSPASAVDFYMIKSVIEGMLSHAAIDWHLEVAQKPFLHPGRSADVVAGGRTLGWIGELHPACLAEWELHSAAAFEVDVDSLVELSADSATFDEISAFPRVSQDIAVVVDEAVSSEAVIASVRQGGGALLESVEIFDLYRGEQIEKTNKSLGLRLSFRAPDRTLSDGEVARLRGSIEKSLARLGGRLRE
jgi:phenylalanyl-tRNA synthetase beta chain